MVLKNDFFLRNRLQRYEDFLKHTKKKPFLAEKQTIISHLEAFFYDFFARIIVFSKKNCTFANDNQHFQTYEEVCNHPLLPLRQPRFCLRTGDGRLQLARQSQLAQHHDWRPFAGNRNRVHLRQHHGKKQLHQLLLRIGIHPLRLQRAPLDGCGWSLFIRRMEDCQQRPREHQHQERERPSRQRPHGDSLHLHQPRARAAL